MTELIPPWWYADDPLFQLTERYWVSTAPPDWVLTSPPDGGTVAPMTADTVEIEYRTKSNGEAWEAWEDASWAEPPLKEMLTGGKYDPVKVTRTYPDGSKDQWRIKA